MKAQVMYELRSKFEFCDGVELAEYFYGVLGDMSPSGKCDIDKTSAMKFIAESGRQIVSNAPSKQAWSTNMLNTLNTYGPELACIV